MLHFWKIKRHLTGAEKTFASIDDNNSFAGRAPENLDEVCYENVALKSGRGLIMPRVFNPKGKFG